MDVSLFERDGRMHVAGDDGGGRRWEALLDVDRHGSPFREVVVWSTGGCVAVGLGAAVELRAIETGDLLGTVTLGDDLFGHFGPADLDTLYVLGWRHVVAIAADRSVRWRSGHVAVDGIVWCDHDGGCLRLSAQLDPPDGWVDVAVDAATGEVIVPLR